MAVIDVNGVAVHYEERGDGPTLLLVHGLGGSTRLWDPVVPALPDDVRLVTYDLRGSGQTSKPPGPYTLELLVDDLAGLVAALELAPAVLVGHSMAGGLVLAYAADHPQDVAAVVGVGAVCEVPDAGREGLRDRAAAVRTDGMHDVARAVAENGTDPSWRERDPEAYERFRASLSASDPEGYAALALVVADLDVTDRLGAVRAPVLLVAGETDPVSPVAANRASAESLPDAICTEIADCGHIIPLERPRELAEALVPFAREHAGRAAGD